MTSGIACGQQAGPQQEQGNTNQRSVDQQEEHEVVELARGARQLRSESKDSGQLSLISSFGSISINGSNSQQQQHQFQSTNQQQHHHPRLASISSQDFTSSNYVDYHQYCSLMLLNSLDFCEEDIIRDDNNQRQPVHQQSHPQLSLSRQASSIEKQQQLQQDGLTARRARWFAGLEHQLHQSCKLSATSAFVADQQQESKSKIKSDINNGTLKRELNNKEQDNNKKAKGGKKFVAALAATQSSLMDKLWTHVVKKSSSNSNSPSANNNNNNISKNNIDTKKQASSGGLLSDLSRRLVRRCGVGSESALAKKAAVKRVATMSSERLRLADTPPPSPLVPTSASCHQLSGSSMMNASVSTLNTATTPSGCCYCDNETCSSSGFVSSSTAPAPTSRATDSCSSSTYNDHHVAGGRSSSSELDHTLASANTTLVMASPIVLAMNHRNRQQEQMADNAAPIIEVPAEQEHEQVHENDSGHQQEVDTGTSNSDSNHSRLKTGKGSSFLSRARNSTINLASLAPITNRFNCSASVGNLRSSNLSSSHQDQHASELLTPEHDDIKTLDYVPCQAFDSNKVEHRVQEVKLVKGLSGAKSCGGSTRKLSSKDKCRRQKDAERVEKLRLLVSYLQSGSSQPIVNPVALEADEIELAERYKLHMALRDDLLDLVDGGSTTEHQQQQTQQLSFSKKNASPTEIRSIAEGFSNHPSASTSSCSIMNNQHYRSSTETVNLDATSKSISKASFRNNSSRDNCCTNVAPTVNATRSTPHIGQTPWMLRHSISDPGNNQFAASNSSTADEDARPSSTTNNSAPQQVGQGAETPSISPIMKHQPPKTISNQNKNDSSYSSSSNQHQPTRLFYIDDLDAPQQQQHHHHYHHHHHEQQQPAQLPPTTTINASNTSMTQASSSGNFSSCSHSSYRNQQQQQESTSTPTKSCSSAWKNPQNLATWIDNEVNSLVHDLEMNESSQKHNYQGRGTSCKLSNGSTKKRWLSVTGDNVRRNSSGAQST